MLAASRYIVFSELKDCVASLEDASCQVRKLD